MFRSGLTASFNHLVYWSFDNIRSVTHSVFVERFTEIERENRILLEKMTNILQNPKGISHANAHLTNPNLIQPSMQKSGQGFTTSTASQIGNRKSLNREARKRELMKITAENQVILKRL